MKSRWNCRGVSPRNRAFLACLVCLLGVATVAQAGPNAGATLTVHGNVTAAETNGEPCVNIPIPGTCEETQPVAQPDAGGVEWFVVLAAGAGPLAFNTVTFGVGTYSTGECYIGFYGPCSGELSPLEIPSAGWPGPNSGTSVSWAPNCLEGMLVPIYYFGVYAYAAGVVPLGDEYPNQPAAFVSCDSPPEEDPIEQFGSFGCGGAQGDVACPTGPPPSGACCFGADCVVLTESDCIGQGGEYQGDGVPCDPNPCGPPPAVGACCITGECSILTEDECVAGGGTYQGDGTGCDPNPCPTSAESRTWGQIKAIYQ